MLKHPASSTLIHLNNQTDYRSSGMSSAERETKRRVTPSASEIVAGNEDLLLEILLRLPPKSLMRFKGVSNQWCSLISDSRFSSRYAFCRLNRHPEGLLAIYGRSKFPLLSPGTIKNYDFFPIEPVRVPDKVTPSLKFLNASAKYVRILQCCNGLALCRSTLTKGRYDSRVTHYVCNLATKQFKVLPSFPGRVKRAKHCIFLALDPYISRHYKVVCACSKRSRKDARWQDEIEIYSSQSGSWNPTPVIHPGRLSLSCARTTRVSWNGWIIWPTRLWRENWCWYFDTNSESMKTMKLPVLQCHKTYQAPNFIPCGSRFFILDFDRDSSNNDSVRQIKVYEMDRGLPEWLLKHTVDVDQMNIRFSYAKSSLFEHDILTGLFASEEDDFSLVIRMRREVIIYSLKHKCSKVIISCDRRHSEPSFAEIHQHYGTLFRP